MDFELPPDSVMLQETLRRFIQKEVRPLEAKFFTTGALTPEERGRLQNSVEQMGLWGLAVPEAYGGGGLDLLTTCLIDLELGATFIPLDIGDVPPLLYACRDEQVERYLQPALAGERRAILATREAGRLLPQDWQTRATPLQTQDGPAYSLEGEKLLAVPPEASDFAILLASTPVDSSTAPTAFLLDLDRPGLTLDNSTGPRLILTGCTLGADTILGDPGGALNLAVDDGPLTWIRWAAKSVGQVERLLEIGAEHAREWQAFGRPLSVRPALRRILAELRVGIECCRWLIFHAAWTFDERGSQAARDPAFHVRLAAGELLERATDGLSMIFTGPGPSPEVEQMRFVKCQMASATLATSLEWARTAVAARELQISRD